MKKIITCIILGLAIYTNAQTVYTFGHDKGGNIIQRSCTSKVIKAQRAFLHDSTSIDSSGNIKITVAPNPTKGLVMVQMENIKSFSTCTWQLFDYSGKIVLNGVSENNPFQFDLTSEPVGIYILKTTTSDIVKSFKIVKE